MIRKAVNTGGDSDDERVTYDDEVVGGSQHDIRSHQELQLPPSKHRNLFQYRKYKGDVDNDNNNEDSISHWNEPNEIQRKGLDFDLNSFQTKVTPKVPASKIVKATDPIVAVKSVPVPITKDVATDRPGHWKSSAVPRAKPVDSRRAAPLPDAKRQKVRSGSAVPAPLKAAAGPPSTTSRALSFSFQPSWMQSSTASSSSSNRRNSLDRSVVEDISEDLSDIYSHQMNQDDWHQPQSEVFTAPGGNDESLTAIANSGMVSTPQRTPGMGVGYSQTGHSSGGGGGGGAALPGSSGGSGRRYSAKARPGTIKAKFQKVMRDVDAGENRMLSITPTHVAVARSAGSGVGLVVDLQDPRSRARLMMDVEVVQLLLPERDYTPFRGVKGVVLFTHQVVKRQSLVSPVTSPSGRLSAAGIACEGGVGDGMEGEGVSDAIAVEGNRVTPLEVEQQESSAKVVTPQKGTEEIDTSSVLKEGVRCTVYFKPSTCSGGGRMLREGFTVRIYDPEVLTNSAKQGNEDIVLICTQCWEPVSGYTAMNSL